MTPPIYLPPGSLVQVSANCINRMYRMVPTDEVVAICNACVRAAAMFFEGKIEIHEFEFLSNHLHMLLTDLGRGDGAGALPDFMGYLHMLLTKNLNAMRGISGSGFEGYSFQIIDRDDTDRILDAILYIQNQAAAANIVERNGEWKHCSSRGLEYGKPSEVDRPNLGIWAGKNRHSGRNKSIRSGRANYAGRSRVRSRLSLTLTPPPGFEGLEPRALRALIRTRLEQREQETIALRQRTDARIVGWDVARRIHFNHMPDRGRELFGVRPTFAASTPERRAAAEERVETFRRAYAVALKRYLGGDQDVVFPHGTYLMPRRFRARVAIRGSS